MCKDFKMSEHSCLRDICCWCEYDDEDELPKDVSIVGRVRSAIALD